jgi:hypothetical protein
VDRRTGDGSINDLPWASVFDPAANARALSAIQAEGFRAASEIVDRFARIATTGLNGKARSTTSAAPLTNDQRADFFGATDIEPLIRSWWMMIGQLLLGSARAPDAPDSDAVDGASLDFSKGEAEGGLHFGAPSPGAAAAEVWLHNRGADDLGRVGLRCSDLLANDGSVISSDAVSLEPASVPMPGRSSRGIDVKIEVPQGVQPGVYRGTLLVEDPPQLWLPVVMTVRLSVT